jgi:hypothetical protein
MTSLLDIGPLTEEVEIRGVTLVVQGLTAGHLFQLFAEYPDMRKLLDGKPDSSPQEIMLALAPDLIAKIIAMATGQANNKEVEAKAKTMGASDQLTILTAVQKLSVPEGISPFVDRVTQLMQGSTPPTVSARTSSPSSVNTATRSPVPFSASLQTDTPGMKLGRVPRAN